MFKKKEFSVTDGQENAMGKEGISMQGNPKREKLIAGWQRDAEQLKLIVPEFDLEAALGEPAFVEALTSGATVFEAYAQVMEKEKAKPEPRREIYQNAQSARRGTGGSMVNPAKLPDKEFRKYIENIRG